MQNSYMFTPFTHSRVKNCDPEIQKVNYKHARSLSTKGWGEANNLETITQQIRFIKGYIDWKGDNRTDGIDGNVINAICTIIETLPMHADVSYSDDLYILILLSGLDQILLNLSMMVNNSLAGSKDYPVREETIKAFKTLKEIFIARLSLGFGCYRKNYITADDLALLARQNSLKSIQNAIKTKKLQVSPFQSMLSGRGGSQAISSDSARQWLVTSIKNRLTPLKTKKQLADLNSCIGLGEFNDFKAFVFIGKPASILPSGPGVYVFLDMDTDKIILIGHSIDVKTGFLQSAQHLGRSLRLEGDRVLHKKFVLFSAQAMNSSNALKRCMQLEEFLKTSEMKNEIEWEQIKEKMKREELKNNLKNKSDLLSSSDEDLKDSKEPLTCTVRMIESGFVKIGNVNKGNQLKKNEFYGSREGADVFIYLGVYQRRKIGILADKGQVYDAYQDNKTIELISVRKHHDAQQFVPVSWRDINLNTIKENYLFHHYIPSKEHHRSIKYIEKNGISSNRKRMPIVVAEINGDLELIAGFTNFKAAKEVAWSKTWHQDHDEPNLVAPCLVVGAPLYEELGKIQVEREKESRQKV